VYSDSFRNASSVSLVICSWSNRWVVPSGLCCSGSAEDEEAAKDVLALARLSLLGDDIGRRMEQKERRNNTFSLHSAI
jgi:hypothetical protein